MRGIILDIEQGTPEWHELRDKSITSSDAPIITGSSPYRTPLQLYEHKLGIKRFDDTGKEWLFAKGHEVEAWAREVYKQETGLNVQPRVVKLGVVPHWEILGSYVASVDGVTDDLSRGVEIKFVGPQSLLRIRDEGIPKHHLDQLDFQMLCCDADEWDYMAVADTGGNSVIINVPRSKEREFRLTSAVGLFAQMLETKTPPQPIDRDFKFIRENNMPGVRRLLNDIARAQMLPDRIRTKNIRFRRLTDNSTEGYRQFLLEIKDNGNDQSSPEDDGA